MEKHEPMRAIDLEQRVREAFYARFSAEQLQEVVDFGGEMDLSSELESIAYEVVPRVTVPETPPGTVLRLTELAVDCSALLTSLPRHVVRSPDPEHALLPDTPLKLLYVNALDLAVTFGVREQERLYRLGAVMSPQARTLYTTMRRKQVRARGGGNSCHSRASSLNAGGTGWVSR